MTGIQLIEKQPMLPGKMDPSVRELNLGNIPCFLAGWACLLEN